MPEHDTEANEATPLDPVKNTSLWTKERITILALSCVNGFMWSVYYAVAVPSLPRYAKTYNFGLIGQAVVLASLQIGWFVGLPFLNKGFLKARSLAYLGASAYVVAPAIVVCHQSFETLIIGRVVEGFGSALLNVLMTSLIAREIPEHCRGFAFGFRNAVSASGLLAGPFVGGILYPYGGLRLPMIMLTTLALCAFLAFALLLKDSWFKGYDERIALMEDRGLSILTRSYELLQDRQLCWLLITHFCSWSFMGSMILAVPHFTVNELNLSSAMTSVFWLVSDIFKVIGGLAGGWMADFGRPWDVLYLGVFSQHSCQLILFFQTMIVPDSVWIFVPVCFLFFAFGTTAPACLKTIASLASKCNLEQSRTSLPHGGEKHEELFSMTDFVTTCALVLGPLYASLVYRFAGFSAIILSFATIGLLVNLSSAFATFELRYGTEERCEGKSW